MRALNQKLVREIRSSTGVLLSVIAIIAVGTGSFVGLRSAQRILESSQHAYYTTYRFADFWVNVKKAPLSAVEPLAQLPGIKALETRVVFDVILDLPGIDRPLAGRLISTPTRGFADTINGIHLVRGSGFSDASRANGEEVILGEAFAEAHGLKPGDSIELILNRKRESFVIVGTAISPEYVYMVRGEGDLVPDPKHFGILYVKDRYAREVLDFQDACNNVVGQLVPGTNQDVELLLEEMDRKLDSYGVLAKTPRDRQASNRFLSDEIKGLGITALIMPTIFLTVAALVLNILMSRLAERQRTVIGTLKAIGYSNRKVLVHFLGFGLVVGVAGGLTGIAVGISMAVGLIRMYSKFYQFPTFLYQLHPDLFLIGMTISIVFALAGTARGVRRVLKLHPAEAMRSKPPERGGAVFLEKFPGLWRRLGFRSHMALRSLARNRGRTLTGIFSSALSTAIVLETLVMYDCVYYMVDFQFEQVAHSDVNIGMRDEKSVAALLEVRDLPAVDYAEPVLGIACDLRKGRYSRRIAITGLSQKHRLTTPMQQNLQPIDVPSEGLVLSRKLAQLLGAKIGDQLELRPIRGWREPRSVRVASIVDSFLGLECYADLHYLSRLVGEQAAISSLQLSVDPARIDVLYRAIKKVPNAQGLSVREDAKANIESTLVETMSFSLGLLIVFAGVISFGSVINSSLVEIAERTRDVSSFCVLGYRPNQIAAIFFRQNMIVFVLGLIVSLPIAYGLIYWIARAYDTELFRMPVIIRPSTVIIGAGISVLFVLIAQWFVYRQIRKLDWLEGIKVKE